MPEKSRDNQGLQVKEYSHDNEKAPMKLEHIAINLSDPQAAARWYAEHLGLQLLLENSTPPFIHFLSDAEGGMLEFYSNPQGAVPDYRTMSPFTLHLAFTVTAIAAARERLLAAGASAEGEITTTPAGDQLAFLRDPWGVPLQLVKRREPFG